MEPTFWTQNVANNSHMTFGYLNPDSIFYILLLSRYMGVSKKWTSNMLGPLPQGLLKRRPYFLDPTSHWSQGRGSQGSPIRTIRDYYGLLDLIGGFCTLLGLLALALALRAYMIGNTHMALLCALSLCHSGPGMAEYASGTPCLRKAPCGFMV